MPLADTKKNHQLPDNFTTVPVVALKTTKVSVPPAQLSNVSAPKEGQLVGAFLKEKSWLEHTSKLLEKAEVEKGDTIAIPGQPSMPPA